MDARIDSASRQRVYAAAGAVVGAAALALQFYLFFANASALGRTPAGIAVQFFSYFTILSNILAVACYAACFAPARLMRFFARASVRTAVGLYIAIVGVVYALVLRQLWSPQGLDKLADTILHYVTPVLYLGFWLAFVDKRALDYRLVPSWLIFPVAYCVYVLARGAASGIYPYPFLEADKLGYAHVSLNIIILVTAFGGIGALLVLAGRALARMERRAA